MLNWFDSITTGITLATITVSLWLGLFLVTRAVHSPRVWLAALTVWAVGSWFLYNVLQMSLPNYGELIWLLWFGQSIKFAPTLWFQLSYQLRLDSGTLSRRQVWLGRVVIVIAYVLTVINILDTSRSFGKVPFPEEIASYILFLVLLIVLPLWTMWNFYQARIQMRLPLLRHQLLQLLVATAVAYVGGLYAGLAIYFKWTIPFYPSRAILGIGVILLGYGVVKYDAILEGRSVERDALYSSVGVGLVTLIYALVAWVLWVTGVASLPAVATFLVCAVITHTLSDGGRTILDRLFYRGHLQRLRTDLRRLSQEAGAGTPLTELLGLVLETVCERTGVQDGFIAIRQEPSDTDFVVVASRDARWRNQQFPAATLSTSELVELDALPEATRRPLESMALLVPLLDNQIQNGVLVLGSKTAGSPYRPEDFDYLESVGPQLATMIESAKQQETRVLQLEQVMEEYRERERSMQQQMQQLVAVPTADLSAASGMDEETMTSLTEDALRHLNDYAYLGTHQFAKLQVVHHYLPATNGSSVGSSVAGNNWAGVTHLEQGKALQRLLIRVIEQLRPAATEPPSTVVPSREWHNFIILHDSYIQGELTRDIMARLYIGEGTYNRTRRRALRSVAKTLHEMESQTQQNNGAAS